MAIRLKNSSLQRLKFYECTLIIVTIASISSESFKVSDECHTGHAYSRIGLIK